MMRRFPSLLLRIAVTIAIFWWLLSRVDVSEVWRRVSEVDTRFVAVSLAFSIAQRVCRSLNWGQLLWALGVRESLLQWKVLRLYFVGGFLGALVPSSATADAIRVLLAKRLFGENLSGLTATALLLNAFTWCAACVVGMTGLLLLAWQDVLPGFLSAATALLIASIAGLAIAYAFIRANRTRVVLWMRKWRLSLFPLRQFLRELMSGVLLLERRTGKFLPILLVALCAQSLGVLCLGALGSGVGIDLPFGSYVVAVPLAAVVSLVPASILGFGAMQAFHVYFFREFGAEQSAALALSALYTTMAVGVHLMIGAGVLLFSDIGRSRVSVPSGS